MPLFVNPLSNRPGIGAATAGAYRNVFKEVDSVRFLAGGGLVDGASQDVGNAGTTTVLRPGLLMGRVTATKKWRPSYFAATQAAYTSGGTTLTLTPAAAVELVRRNGASGTFRLTGATAANGTPTTVTVTYSAVNTSTGVVTISDIGANRAAGALVGAGDGSEVPRSVIPDGYGVTLPDGTDQDWPHVPVAGVIESAKLIDWPTDTGLQQFIMDSLSANGAGVFTFDHLLNPA